VNEIGERIAESVVSFFREEKNREIVEELRKHGLNFSLSEAQLKNQTDLLKGKTLVVSGVFENLERTELKKLIEDNGGKVSSSISSKTSYLVAGNNMGPSKRSKAENLGVPIISESEFLNLIK
ncbi:MAG: NAD-dependent DNA ligase LigA, partial [Eudoraea sp.]|nr:NAD-dependent DNA ligase LigA [Eudoraea sp.]